MRHPRKVVAPLVLAALVAACGPAPTAEPKPTPGAVALLTQAQPASSPPQCDGGLLEGELVPSERSGLGVEGVDGVVQAVRWPFGFSAMVTSIGGGRTELSDARGFTVAFTGDLVVVGGGLGPDGLWFACGAVARVQDP